MLSRIAVIVLALIMLQMTEVRQAGILSVHAKRAHPSMLLVPSPNDDAQSAPPPQRRPVLASSPTPPPRALLNEDSPMQLKPPASCCNCMTNRTAVISHGLSFFFPLTPPSPLLLEAEEMEEYTRVPVAAGTDSEDCECVRACVFVVYVF